MESKMIYTPSIEGFEGQKIEIKSDFWSGYKLFINGQPAPKGLRRNEMLLQRNDGQNVTAVWKPQVIGLDVPLLLVDGKVIKLEEPLKCYQWLWGGLPITLVFFGGFVGALFGLLGFSFNAKIFRSSLNPFVKYLTALVVTFFIFIIYFAVALALRDMIYH